MTKDRLWLQVGFAGLGVVEVMAMHAAFDRGSWPLTLGAAAAWALTCLVSGAVTGSLRARPEQR